MSREFASAILLTLLWPPAAAVSLAVAVRGDAVSAIGLMLLAASTSAAYAFDRILDRPIGDGPALRRFLIIAFAITALAAFVLAWFELWRVAVCTGLALLSMSYVPLKRVVPKNVLATTAWTLSVVILPGVTAPAWNGEFAAAAAAVACIMFANTTLCDLASMKDDKRERVRSITVCYGTTAATLASAVAAFAGTVIAVDANALGLTVTATTLAAISLLLMRSPAWFSARLSADAVITLLPGPIALLIA